MAPEGRCFWSTLKSVLMGHIIGGLLSISVQQAVLLNSIKEKCEGLGNRGLS